MKIASNPVVIFCHGIVNNYTMQSVYSSKYVNSLKYQNINNICKYMYTC